MKPKDYLTDAELLALIETTESGPLLTPPRNMKQNILSQAAKPVDKMPSRQQQFVSYCLRVGLATAACLAVLLIPSPAKDSIQESTAPSLTISQHLNQFTDRLEQGFSIANRSFADFDFNFDFGGTRDE